MVHPSQAARPLIRIDDLKTAKAHLRPLSSSPVKNPGPSQLRVVCFDERQTELQWDHIEPCRVSPVWLEVPTLAQLPKDKVGQLQHALARVGLEKAELTPLVAGYSGAQPFRLTSPEGDFFVKAILVAKKPESSRLLEGEVRVMEAMTQSGVTPRLFGHETNSQSDKLSFFVSELSAAKPLETEPFRSESIAWALRGEVGPLLSSWVRMLRAFHQLPPASYPLHHATRMHGINDWFESLKKATQKDLVGGQEQQDLSRTLVSISKAYRLRERSDQSVFLHGDMHASNIRYDEAQHKLVAIDFGDSGIGDPARELAYFFFMMDAPMRLAAPLTRLYQRDVLKLNEAFYERTLLALAGERVGRYLKILGWSGRQGQATQSYQRQISEDLSFIGSWV